jgi:putative membrane protein
VGLAQKRTGLAKFRTQLALDRTALAWIRTALTMATFGFGTVGFFRSLRAASPTPEAIHLHRSAIAFGVGLVVLGIVATVLAGVTQWLALRRLERDEVPVLSRWPLTLTVSVLLAILGLVALWSLLAR